MMLNKNVIRIFLCFLPYLVIAQPQGDKSTYFPNIVLNSINGIQVFESNDLNDIIWQKLKTRKLTEGWNDIVKFYFVNRAGDKYLKLYGYHDFSGASFYTIGYTKAGKCSECGDYLGKLDVEDFVLNEDIKLGQSFEKVSVNNFLLYYRDFLLNGVHYYYYEEGPFTGTRYTEMHNIYSYYYKFKSKVLIEVGFGYGLYGMNPMMHSD